MVKKTSIPALSDQPNGDFGRKPYMVGKSDGDLTHVEFLHGADAGGTFRALFKRTTQSVLDRAVARFLEHSQFKKPYMGDEFPEMEHFADLMQFDPVSPWAPPEMEFGNCVVICDIATRGRRVEYLEQVDDCPALIEISWNKIGHFEVPNPSEDIFLVSATRYSGRSPVGPDAVLGVEAAEWQGIAHSYQGEISNRQGFRITGMAGIPSGETVVLLFAQPNPLTGTDCGVVAEEAWNPDPTDPNKGCVDNLVVASCDIPCGIEWDYELSDETITQNGTAEVYIMDPFNSGPYTWEVFGDGFTLDNAQTAGLTNILRADGTSCGSAFITVTTATEGCVSAAGYVRNVTSGKWEFSQNIPKEDDDIMALYVGRGYDSFTSPIFLVSFLFTKAQGKWRLDQPVQRVTTFQDFCPISGGNFDHFYTASTSCTVYPGGYDPGPVPCCVFGGKFFEFRVGLQSQLYEWVCP